MTESKERANRVSIQVVEGGFEARFFRTHKHVATIASVETGFQPDDKQNKTLQREMFRVWVCEHAGEYGVEWDPTDKRTDDNRRTPRYSSDDVLMGDAIALVESDIRGFVDGCNIDGLHVVSIDAEEIIPMAKSPKGTDLSQIGIEDGKYANGNWAWATIKIVATVKLGDCEAYVTLECQLVSGQLKKPTNIDGGGYNQTSFKNAIAEDIKPAMPVQDEPTQDSQDTTTPVKKSKKEKKVEA